MSEGHDWTIATLKELFERLIVEHDRRYAERFTAQEQAFKAAFEASNTAIAKAEVAQTAYNARSNEFRAALDDQAKQMLTRAEADARFANMRELIDRTLDQLNTLQRGESRGAGSIEAQAKSRQQANWIIGLVVAVGLNLLGLAAALIYFLLGKH